MAQHDYNIANATAPNFRTDLNNNLSAIVSQNSGTSAPSNTFANMIWYDTTNNILKMRNEADSAWISLFTLDQSGNLANLTNSTGVDSKSVSGTAGTSGNLTSWNVDGDLVDGGKGATVIIPPTTDTTSELSWEDWDTTNIHSFEIFLDLDPATIGSVLMQFWSGTAWYTAASYYWYRKTTKFNDGITETNPRAASDTSIELSPNDADEFKYHFKFINPTLQPAGRSYIEWSGIYNVPVSDAYHVIGAGYYASSASFSGVKIFMAPEADSSTFSADALCIGHYR